MQKTTPLRFISEFTRPPRRRRWFRVRGPASWPRLILPGIKLAAWMLIYLILTFFAIDVLEPGLTPPGFTGRGAWAMLIVFAGAFHLAKVCRRPVVFLAFGLLGAMLLLPSYFDTRLGFRLSSGITTRLGVVVGWVLFVLGVGFVTRWCAAARWRMMARRPPGGCRQCGYDLTGNVSGVCPECGTPTHTDPPS